MPKIKEEEDPPFAAAGFYLQTSFSKRQIEGHEKLKSRDVEGPSEWSGNDTSSSRPLLCLTHMLTNTPFTSHS